MQYPNQFLIGSIKKVIFQKYTYNSKATKIELKNTKITLVTTGCFEKKLR